MNDRNQACLPDGSDSHCPLDPTIPDSRAVDMSLRASVVIALRIYNSQILEGQLRSHIAQALNARSVGQVRRIVAAVDRLLLG